LAFFTFKLWLTGGNVADGRPGWEMSGSIYLGVHKSISSCLCQWAKPSAGRQLSV